MIFQFLVLAVLIILLINYKATGGLSRIHQVRSTGQLQVPVLRNGGPPGSSALESALAYLKIVWPALVFGVLISAAARTSLARTPLERLFGHFRIAVSRLAMALVLVLAGSAWVGRLAEMVQAETEISGAEARNGRWRKLLWAYAPSLMDVTLRTIPLVLVGIWASMWIMHRIHPQFESTAGIHALVTLGVALIAAPLTLPTMFEIPLALSLLAGAGQAGAAAALLVAGPAVNIPSLLVIGRYGGWKLATGLALLVCSVACVGGLLVR